MFSYLMALYVWYDGKDLAEKYGIVKNAIKTDQDEELEESGYEDSIEASEKIDFESGLADPDSDLDKDLEWVTNDSKTINSAQLKSQNIIKEQQQRDILLSTNSGARDYICRETGVDPKMYMNGGSISTIVELPDSLFLDNDDYGYGIDENGNKINTVLSGNLADWWDKV